jgi:SRSO17 transposase
LRAKFRSYTDDYRDRRKKCKLPEEAVFRTNPDLAAEMLEVIGSENRLPFKYVVADSVYGMSPDFTEAVEALPETTYFVSVPKSTLCWLKRLMTNTLYFAL